MTFQLWNEDPPLVRGRNKEDLPVITAYFADTDADSAVIVCPGGGYRQRAEHEGEPVAKWLNTLGIHAFVLHYRVAPYRFPAALADVLRAIRYVRYHVEQWQINENKIGILGFSAGGHLCASAGTLYDKVEPSSIGVSLTDPIDQCSARPDLLMLCYPVISMKEPHVHAGSKLNLLGEEPEEAMVALLSLDEQVNAGTPPAFLWHTADDQAVPVENSLRFAAALSRHQVPFDLHVYEKGRHGLGLASDDKHVGTWSDVCGIWLKKSFSSQH